VLFFAALIVVLLLVAPHKPRIPDPPTKIDEFIPLPILPPGTASLGAIPTHPVIERGYQYIPRRLDRALAQAVAENGRSLGGAVRVNWDKTMRRGNPHFVTLRVARRALESFEEGLQGSFTKSVSGVEITTRMHALLRSDGGVDIAGGEPPTQLIDGGEHYTQWLWVVSPKALGPHKLSITLECLITGDHVPETSSVSYQDYLDVEVHETLWDFGRRFFDTKMPDLLSVLVTAILSMLLTSMWKGAKERLSKLHSDRRSRK
jgi:hypothetical protein